MRVAFYVDDFEAARAVVPLVNTVVAGAAASVELIAVIIPEQPDTGEAWSGSLERAAEERAEQLNEAAPDVASQLDSLAAGLGASAAVTVLSGDEVLRGEDVVDVLGEHFEQSPPDLIAMTVPRDRDAQPAIGDTFVALLAREYAPLLAFSPRTGTGLADGRSVPLGSFVFTSDGVELGSVTAHTLTAIDVEGPFGARRFGREAIQDISEGRVALNLDSTNLPGVE